jgi:hypothetical protein
MASPLKPPRLPLPPPLRGVDDAPTAGFTYDSITRRLPLILDELVAHAMDTLPHATVAAIAALRAEIVRDAPLSPPSDATWAAYVAPHAGCTWLTAPWWLVENYTYQRVREAVAMHGGPADVFAPQKAAALHGARRAFVQSVLPIVAGGGGEGGKIGDDALPGAVYRSLWGNRADLSLHTVAALATGAAGGSGGSGATGDADPNAGLLLVDDVPAAVAIFRAATASAIAASPAAVAVVLDNCGLELLSDLALVDALLRDGGSSPGCVRVTLWAKAAPVFVSDAQPHDVDAHVAWLDSAAAAAAVENGGSGSGDGVGDETAGMRALAARLRGYLADGSLVVASHAFFCSPLAFWDAPSDLVGRLSGCALVIAKGDANYRRLLGDAHWAHDTPWAEVTGYFPAPLLALRTAKSGIVAGLPPGAEAAAAAAHPADWLTSGRYGMAQLGGRL